MSDHLIWGGCDTVGLAREYGTPLYVMDEAELRSRCRRLSEAEEEGLCLDTVSLGELYLAHKAGFPMERVTLHGNAKTEAFLRAGLEWGAGTVVVDSEDELRRLDGLCAELGKTQKILFRVSPGIEAHTFSAVQTAQKDCKFGVPLAHLERAVKAALSSPHIDLAGLHVHVGSQIHDTAAHFEAVSRLTQLLAQLRGSLGFEARELDLGGGFGIPELPGEPGTPAEEFISQILDRVDSSCEALGLRRPEVAFEPGRWIVGEAGITLYTVQGVKEIPEVRTYVAVDGGMTDNPRPQLYQARYAVLLANDVDRPVDRRAAIAGPCCESGDLLTADTPVPELEVGDVLAVQAGNDHAVVPLPRQAVQEGEGVRLGVLAEGHDPQHADHLVVGQVPAGALDAAHHFVVVGREATVDQRGDANGLHGQPRGHLVLHEAHLLRRLQDQPALLRVQLRFRLERTRDHGHRHVQRLRDGVDRHLVLHALSLLFHFVPSPS